MKRILAVLALVLSALTTLPLAGQTQGPGPEYVPGEVLVEFVAEATARQISVVGKPAASFSAWAKRQSPTSTEISLPQRAARVGRPRRTAARDHHDKSWQIAAFRSQSVAQPGPKARPSWLLVAGLQIRNRRIVVDGLRMH